jgi:putative ABC transport system permease protein
MLPYYLAIGVRNLRRSPVLTGLMVLTLAVGVAASIATLTILHVMAGNPIPAKSDRLLVPMMDNGPVAGFTPGDPPGDDQISYRDARNLLDSRQGVRRTVAFGVAAVIENARPDLPIEELDALATTADYFAMFQTPFLYGGPWSDKEDRGAARVVVLTRRESEKLFGEADPVGRDIRLLGQTFRVVGVLDTWNPVPRYTHPINGSGGPFAGAENAIIPFATAVGLELRNNGNTRCQKDYAAGFQNYLDSECTWIQPWVEVGSAADRAAVQDWLNGYVAEQRRSGRLLRDVPPQLYDVMEWMARLKIVKNDPRLAVWLAFGFLLLCLINTVGLLLAKFSVRATEVGVRRALGATRRAIFLQFLVEAAVVGLAGGVVGLLLSLASLAFITQRSRELSVVAAMDGPMLAMTFVLAVAASLLAGLLPTWRACQVAPALQLKSQ